MDKQQNGRYQETVIDGDITGEVQAVEPMVDVSVDNDDDQSFLALEDVGGDNFDFSEFQSNADDAIGEFAALDEPEPDGGEGEGEGDDQTGADNTLDEPTLDDQKPDKYVQTPEERAYYAEMRRQREMAERMQQLPEFQIAQMLQQQYGKSAPEILNALQEAKLQQEAERRGVTPEHIRQERFLQQQQELMQKQQQMFQMQSFMTRIEAEGRQLQQKYPQLKPDDLTDAVIYMMEQKAIGMPLEQAVRALHAEKLFNNDREAIKQEILAELSGRARTPIPPQSGRPTKTATLTAEERYFAKQMGVSEADYLKYKTE